MVKNDFPHLCRFFLSIFQSQSVFQHPSPSFFLNLSFKIFFQYLFFTISITLFTIFFHNLSLTISFTFLFHNFSFTIFLSQSFFHSLYFNLCKISDALLSARGLVACERRGRLASLYFKIQSQRFPVSLSRTSSLEVPPYFKHGFQRRRG